MTQLTPNYSLKKPDTTDNADLTVFVGQNMDTLDSLLAQRVQKDPTYGTNVNTTNSAFRAHAQAGGQTMGAGAINKITFETVDFDVLGEYSTSLNRFTANTAGVYVVSACFRLAAATTNQTFMSIYKNGTEYTRLQNFINGGTTSAVVQAAGCTVLKLAATDYLEIYGYSSIASSIQGVAAMSSGAQPTFFAITKIA